jgi:hypothetical protein
LPAASGRVGALRARRRGRAAVPACHAKRLDRCVDRLSDRCRPRRKFAAQRRRRLVESQGFSRSAEPPRVPDSTRDLPARVRIRQAAKTKERKNPAAVAKALSGRPCSEGSGISVSASEARTAPPANASANARTVVAEAAGDRPANDHRQRQQCGRRGARRSSPRASSAARFAWRRRRPGTQADSRRKSQRAASARHPRPARRREPGSPAPVERDGGE